MLKQDPEEVAEIILDRRIEELMAPKEQVLPPFRLANSEQRKRYPIFSGVFAYFADALGAVANVSWNGNNKHNPGEALHWARSKSSDHLDCAARHLIQAQWADDAEDHLAEAAWRILAALQLRIEQKWNLPPPANASE